MIDKHGDQSATSEPWAKRSVERAVTSPVLPPVSRVPLLWLSVGVVAAVLFTLIYLIEGVTRPGYNAWPQPVSALSLGPGGWIQQAPL